MYGDAFEYKLKEDFTWNRLTKKINDEIKIYAQRHKLRMQDVLHILYYENIKELNRSETLKSLDTK